MVTRINLGLDLAEATYLRDTLAEKNPNDVLVKRLTALIELSELPPCYTRK